MNQKAVERGTPEFEKLAMEVHSPRARWDHEGKAGHECEFRIKQQLYTLAVRDSDTPRHAKMRKEIITEIELLERRMSRKGFA